MRLRTIAATVSLAITIAIGYSTNAHAIDVGVLTNVQRDAEAESWTANLDGLPIATQPQHIGGPVPIRELRNGEVEVTQRVEDEFGTFIQCDTQGGNCVEWVYWRMGYTNHILIPIVTRQ